MTLDELKQVADFRKSNGRCHSLWILVLLESHGHPSPISGVLKVPFHPKFRRVIMGRKVLVLSTAGPQPRLNIGNRWSRGIENRVQPKDVVSGAIDYRLEEDLALVNWSLLKTIEIERLPVASHYDKNLLTGLMLFFAANLKQPWRFLNILGLKS